MLVSGLNNGRVTGQTDTALSRTLPQAFLADVWAASRVSVVKHKPGCVSSQPLLPVFIQRGCVQQFVKHLQVLISFFVEYM